MTEHTKRADALQIGDWIGQGDYPPLCIEHITTNSLGDVVLRCSYSGPGAYPGTSLLLRPEEKVTLAAVGKPMAQVEG